MVGASIPKKRAYLLNLTKFTVAVNPALFGLMTLMVADEEELVTAAAGGPPFVGSNGWSNMG